MRRTYMVAVTVVGSESELPEPGTMAALIELSLSILACGWMVTSVRVTAFIDAAENS
jgi:hypothetical protein